MGGHAVNPLMNAYAFAGNAGRRKGDRRRSAALARIEVFAEDHYAIDLVLTIGLLRFHPARLEAVAHSIQVGVGPVVEAAAKGLMTLWKRVILILDFGTSATDRTMTHSSSCGYRVARPDRMSL